MSCAKCGQDKPTPVTFNGKQYCLGCASAIIEDEHDRELRFQDLQVKLSNAKVEKSVAESKLPGLEDEHRLLLLQRDEIEKKLAESEWAVTSTTEDRDAAVNQIDKLTAELEKAKAKR